MILIQTNPASLAARRVPTLGATSQRFLAPSATTPLFTGGVEVAGVGTLIRPPPNRHEVERRAHPAEPPPPLRVAARRRSPWDIVLCIYYAGRAEYNNGSCRRG